MEKKLVRYEKPILEELDATGKGQFPCSSGSVAGGACGAGGIAAGACGNGGSPN
jgi:hypothetical protein